MIEFIEWFALVAVLPLCVFGAIAYLVGRSIAKDTDDAIKQKENGHDGLGGGDEA